jgi:hypothetical protein
MSEFILGSGLGFFIGVWFCVVLSYYFPRSWFDERKRKNDR